MTDAEYRALLRQDPNAAHRALFDAYCGYVYAIVYRRLHAVAGARDIEECVSDVFADVFFGYHADSAHAGDLRGFIGAVAGRRAVDAYRRCARVQSRSIPMEALAEQASGENIPAQAEAAERSRILLECIEALGEPDASIVLQRYYYGIPAADIAAAWKLTPAAVRMRCSRAMKRLRSALADRGITGTEG
ncbi:MAG: sigma-70 family RNA polymerase sigma factor [Oscillospiraceae bacterium]|nr:sigma-70 family RNA polymerase sigma factor [Oscillospiraceae bacterium]